MLSWAAVVGATEYNIYRATTPYFTPATPYATTTDTTWTDPDANALGDPAANYYYIVRVVNNCAESTGLQRLGEFDFTLVPGS
ncbi:MAG: hypothetical protein GY764_10435 [Halieaceae bacterium]|nr:hypothetical protein [Halieaceae bacterium]